MMMQAARRRPGPGRCGPGPRGQPGAKYRRLRAGSSGYDPGQRFQSFKFRVTCQTYAAPEPVSETSVNVTRPSESESGSVSLDIYSSYLFSLVEPQPERRSQIPRH
jgi:hypothetical protein